MARAIAVHSFKGGTGKSTITANLAAALAMQGRRVGVMDMDLETPGLHVIFNIEPKELRYTLNDVLAGVASPEDATIRMTERLGLPTGELYYCPASIKLTDMLRSLKSGFEVRAFADAIRSLNDNFKLHFLLIDTHPGLGNETLLAMGACDDMLLVSRVDQQDIFGTGVMVEVSTSLNKPCHLVFNMIPPGVKEPEVSRFAKTLGAHFAVDAIGWLPFSDKVIGSLSKSVFVLTRMRDAMASRFNRLAETVASLPTGQII